jgi:dihydroxyacetone kinase-like predicted kinase
MTAAQGNAGIIYTGFLAGFLPVFGNEKSINAHKLTQAFKQGFERAEKSIQNPKEGTILDVMKATAQSLEKQVENEKDIVLILEKAAGQAHQALLETQEKLEILKKAGVVDAGGLGFLIILESFLEVLEVERKKDIKTIRELAKEKPSEKVKRFIQTISNRYEIVALIKNPKFSEKEIGDKLSKLGNSLDIVTVKNKMKIHIHTDLIDEVKEFIRQAGRIENMRIEDMIKEAVGQESLKDVSIGIITDQTADLTAKIIERYKIKIVRSQNFLEVYKEQLKSFKKVLIITGSSDYNQAMEARLKLEDPSKIYVLNSFNISSGQALLILRAIELIKEQREIQEVIKELNKTISHIHTYLFLSKLEKIKKISKISYSQVKWAKRVQRIGAQPLFSIKRGKIIKNGIHLMTKDISSAIFREIKLRSRKYRKQGRKIRIVITHYENLEEAKKLKNKLKEIQAEVSFTNSSSLDMDSGSLIVSWTIINNH